MEFYARQEAVRMWPDRECPFSIREVYYPIDTGYDEPFYYTHDFIPLNGDELVIPYDSDHVYISDAFETGEISLITGEYVTHKGKAYTLIRKQ